MLEHPTSASQTGSRFGDDVRRVLEASCTRRGIALLVAHDVQGVCEARFAGIDTECVRFEIQGQQGVPAFRSMSLCTVSFHHESRLRLFVTRVLDFEPPRNGAVPGKLTVSLPRQLTAQDARLMTRVPVSASAGLEVRVQTPGGEIHEATPLNLSMSGILFELRNTWLEPDTGVEVELRLGATSVTLPGVVRRQHRETCFGVLFPSAVKGDAIAAPNGLTDIVTRLEGSWATRPVSIF